MNSETKGRETSYGNSSDVDQYFDPAKPEATLIVAIVAPEWAENYFVGDLVVEYGELGKHKSLSVPNITKNRVPTAWPRKAERVRATPLSTAGWRLSMPVRFPPGKRFHEAYHRWLKYIAYFGTGRQFAEMIGIGLLVDTSMPDSILSSKVPKVLSDKIETAWVRTSGSIGPSKILGDVS